MPDIAEEQPKTSFVNDLVSQMQTAREAANKQQLGTPATPPPPPETPATPPPAVAATPPPADKPPEAPWDADIESGKRPPKGEDWKRIKTAHAEETKQYKTKVDTYERELTELKKAPKHNAKLIEELTAERDRYKTIHDTALVEFSPQFNEKFQAQLDTELAGLKERFGDKADKLFQAFHMPEGEAKKTLINEILGDADQFSTASAVAAERQVSSILRQRQNELKNAQTKLAEIVGKRKTEEEERQKQFDASFQTALEAAKADMPVLQMKDNDKPWNTQVEERVALAKNIYSGNFENDGQRAQAAFWAASAPTFLKQLAEANKEIGTLKETITKLQAASPGMSGSGERPQVKGDPKRPFTSNWEPNLKAAQQTPS